MAGTPPTQILVAEFLLANAEASRLAADSMLDEARAMLTAIVTDLAAVPNVEVTVLLSEGTNPFTAPLPNARIIHGELQPETLPKILNTDSQPVAFDAVLLIAPECDGVLVSLLKTIQETQPSTLRSLNIDWRLAEIFADKKATDSWLRQHGIATIPTQTIDDATARELQASADQIVLGNLDDSKTNQFAVLKPRDGAGADSVRIVPFPDQSLAIQPPRSNDNDRWILQPLIPGTPCSVGFIGGGGKRPTIILPPGRQNILNIDGRLSYHGGEVPCDASIAMRIAPVAEQLAIAFGPFNGYMGADLLVDLSLPQNSEWSVVVVEINPRLCTSYVGYRALAMENLAELLLQRDVQRPVQWKDQCVSFAPSILKT